MQIGDFAKYRNTGTVGKVMEIMDRPEGQWVLLDTYDLYYDAIVGSTDGASGPAEGTNRRIDEQHQPDHSVRNLKPFPIFSIFLL
jgi:hypothetical protein